MVLSRQTLKNKNNRGGRRQNINFREGCVIALATWLIPVARQTGSRHRVTWRHREHSHTIVHGHFPIGCPLEPSRYLASFPRYLAPNLRQRLLRDDVINDVIRPGSAILEDHIGLHIPYREHCRRSRRRRMGRSGGGTWPLPLSSPPPKNRENICRAIIM